MGLVRIYYHENMEQPPAPPGTLRQPYLAGQVIDLQPGQTVSSDKAPRSARYVLVQPDEVLHIEICPPNREVQASDMSPLLSCDAIYSIGPDWTVSIKMAEVG